MKKSRGERLFTYGCYGSMAIISFMTIYPLIYVFSASMSSADAVASGRVLLMPIEVNFAAYRKVFEIRHLFISYGNTLYYLIVGTFVCMLFTITSAYALSKKRLMGRKFLIIVMSFTMWLKAGIIPDFLNYKDLGLYNTRAAPIIGFAVVVFNVILLKTYFETIPTSLEASAQVDGANDLRILWSIYLPLSKPGLMAVALFYGVYKWNGYFWSMILLRDESKIPLQVFLRKLIVEMNGRELYDNALEMAKLGYSVETVVYATIVISILPVLIVFPFVQKYLVNGIVIKAEKE